MGFLGGSASFTRFRILDEVPDETVFKIPDKLKQFAFKDIDDIPEIRSFGWVCYDDMLDCDWHTAPPQKGEFVLFSLRLDTRRIPPAVIKKHLALALGKERLALAENGKNFISRDRKSEIKEKVLLGLRQRFLPVPAEFNVVWSIPHGIVWFASTQTKMVDMFMELFLATFDLHLEELTPFNLAASMLDEDQISALENVEETQFTTSGAN